MPRWTRRPILAPPARSARRSRVCHAGQYPDARAVADHGEGQPHEVVQEGGRQGQARRRHRRDRDRQGNDGIRGDRRGHACQDRGAGGHAGRAGPGAHRRAGGGGGGCESGSGRRRQSSAARGTRGEAAAKTGRHRGASAIDGSGRFSAARASGAASVQAKRAPAVRRGDGEGIARTNRVFSSPLARRLAKEAGIDLARVGGSGPHGRVVARDVEAAKSGRGIAAPAMAAAGAVAPSVQPPTDQKIRALFEPGSYDVVPHDNIRKVIARRLLEAKLTIPHFYLTLECNIGKLLAAREEINAAAPKDKDGKAAYKISVNDFVIKAL